MIGEVGIEGLVERPCSLALKLAILMKNRPAKCGVIEFEGRNYGCREGHRPACHIISREGHRPACHGDRSREGHRPAYHVERSREGHRPAYHGGVCREGHRPAYHVK